MIFFARRWLLTLCLTCLAAGVTHASELSVVIVSPDRSAAYQEATNALINELENGGVPRSEVRQFTVVEWASAGILRPRLFVALGVEASSALVKMKLPVPVLCTLLPQQSFERILSDNAQTISLQLSALYLNQPLTRQLDLVRLALPKARRVGGIFGPESRNLEQRLEVAATARGFELISATIELGESVFSGLKKILDDSDVLLALPDPYVYNSGSIQNILLASYRVRVPMVAFSPAYVRAGALLALYSTPAQIGQQAGGVVRRVLQGRTLGGPEYPQHFTIGVNENVARSMGLSLDAQELTAQLQRQERKP